MDIKKIGQFDTLTPNPVGKNYIPGQGPSFKETLAKTAPTETSKHDLKKSLQGLQNLGVVDTGIKFSNHAIDRMNSRGISFKQEDLSKLNEAVDRAASKGSKDSLILMNDTALIVSVKNRTVVTVMDKAALKENVFTNIDSTIVM